MDRIKLILDTDIGTDVDDAWALALCLASDEIDLLGVTLAYGHFDVRAKITLKMLKLAGRTDIPVYNGVPQPLTPDKSIFWGGHEGTDTDFSDITSLSVKDNAVDFMLETVNKYPGEIVICPIGPMTNLGEAIRRNPETMHKVKRFAIMGTTYTGEGIDAASPEHNGCCDPVATKIVLESGIPATVVGLNVTTKVTVDKEDIVKLKASLFADYLAAMTYQYFGIIGRDYTFMHDPLAVATLIDPSVVTTRKMRAEVLEDGRVVYNSDDAGVLDVCTDVDAEKFKKLLLSKINALSEKGD